MSTAATERNYLNADYSLWSWLVTTDHKRIGILYLISISVFFFLGGVFAVLMRLELATPAGDLVQPDTGQDPGDLHAHRCRGIVEVLTEDAEELLRGQELQRAIRTLPVGVELAPQALRTIEGDGAPNSLMKVKPEAVAVDFS